MIRPLTLITLAASLAAGLAAPGALAASSAAVEAAFGNTIVSTYPDGRVGKLWLKPGGTYAAEGRRHDPSSGRWSVKGDKLCLKQSKPLPVPFNYCTPIPQDGLDHAWSAKAATGEDIRVQVVMGQA